MTFHLAAFARLMAEADGVESKGVAGAHSPVGSLLRIMLESKLLKRPADWHAVFHQVIIVAPMVGPVCVEKRSVQG